MWRAVHLLLKHVTRCGLPMRLVSVRNSVANNIISHDNKSGADTIRKMGPSSTKHYHIFQLQTEQRQIYNAVIIA